MKTGEKIPGQGDARNTNSKSRRAGKQQSGGLLELDEMCPEMFKEGEKKGGKKGSDAENWQIEGTQDARI